MIETLLDKNQIEQIFINLLLNAIQASEEKAAISIKSYIKFDRKWIVAELSDSGSGISPGDLSKIDMIELRSISMIAESKMVTLILY